MELTQSNVMSSKSGLENKVIRVSEILRKELGLNLGEFVVLNNVALQVDKIFARDLIRNPSSAFVTKNVLTEVGGQKEDLAVTRHITMGCDPELFLVDSLTNQLYNPTFLFKKWDSIGYDGMLAELRPMPSVDPAEVVSNLRDMIVAIKRTLFTKNLDHVRMISKSSGWGLFAGFHIHMGIPKNLLNPYQIGYTKILRVVVKALDYYVGTLAVLAEGDDCTRRCSPFVNYGKVGDHRVDMRTLEYRVPGGMLLKHPGLTHGLISLCSLVAHDTLERLRVFTHDFTTEVPEDENKLLAELYPNALGTKDMFDIICSTSTKKTKIEAEKVKKDLICMINYPFYEKSVEQFIILAQSRVSENIWLNWQ